MLSPLLRRQNLGLDLLKLVQDLSIGLIDATGFFLPVLLIKSARTILSGAHGSPNLIEAFLSWTLSREDFVDTT